MMNVWIRVLLAIVFYCIAGMIYFFSIGKFRFKDNKQEKYEVWMRKHGVKASKSIKILVLLYTLFMILEYVL